MWRYIQAFLTGTITQLTYVSSRSSLNSPAFDVNPYTNGYLDL